MRLFSTDDLIRITNGHLVGKRKSTALQRYAIHSSKCEDRTCFLALPGTRVHGALFLPDAFRRGAAAAMVDDRWWRAQAGSVVAKNYSDRYSNIVIVEDVREALWHLASAYRAHVSPGTIAITGSSGKTSTKEILRQLLQPTCRVHASPESFNNDLGVPLTLLNLSDEDAVYVQEMGASQKGSIARLSELVRPDVGVLTNVGPAHLAGFGSLAGVYDGKMELAHALKRTNGMLVCNGDDPELRRRVSELGVNHLFFGFDRENDRYFSHIERTERGTMLILNDGRTFDVALEAHFQAENILAALTAAEAAGLSVDGQSHEFRSLEWPKQRFQRMEIGGGITLIDDTYNANPLSFRSSIETFLSLSFKRHIVVCGDMLELGADQEQFHAELGRWLACSSAAVVVCVGRLMCATAEAIGSRNGHTIVSHHVLNAEASQFLRAHLGPGDGVLIKASRGMHLDEIVKDLAECFTLSQST